MLFTLIVLSFDIKGRWQGSAPFGCTLPHSKPLAHWRQVRRNIHSRVATPGTTWSVLPPGGAPPPGSHNPSGLWDMGLTPGGRSGTFNPGWLPPVPPDLSSPQEGPPPGPLDPSHASLPPLFYPQPVCHCHLCIALAATQPALEKRIINGIIVQWMKTAAVLIGDVRSRGAGRLPSSFVHAAGHLAAKVSPPPGICHPREKKC